MSGKSDGHDNAGAIRAAGGAFGKLEAAHEEEYFYKLVGKKLFKRILLTGSSPF
jgi:hypothetical protein